MEDSEKTTECDPRITWLVDVVRNARERNARTLEEPEEGETNEED
jgi:hypothetical protein